MTIEGVWINELSSTLTITQVSNGTFQGTYQTVPSEGDCANGVYEVQGVTDTDSGGVVVGFSVVWKNDLSNCSSVTAWSGQLQSGAIITTWLLCTETTVSNDWKSTIVGQDIFYSASQIPQTNHPKAKSRQHSHP